MAASTGPVRCSRSYLVHDGTVAFMVDPQRDIDRILALLGQRDLRLTHVFESHMHNDYITGGLALARRTGAAYLVNAEDELSFERTPVRNGQVVQVGPRMQVTAVATPGHTFTHLSYVLTDLGVGEPMAVFSGGSLLYGATGRPDRPARAAAHRRPGAGTARLACRMAVHGPDGLLTEVQAGAGTARARCHKAARCVDDRLQRHAPGCLLRSSLRP